MERQYKRGSINLCNWLKRNEWFHRKREVFNEQAQTHIYPPASLVTPEPLLPAPLTSYSTIVLKIPPQISQPSDCFYFPQPSFQTKTLIFQFFFLLALSSALPYSSFFFCPIFSPRSCLPPLLFIVTLPS